MILLHLLLAVAFVLLYFVNRRLDALTEAFKTQGKINEVQKEAYDALTDVIGSTFDKFEEELAKKSNKRSKKTPRKD